MLDITPIMMVSMSIATNRIETPSNGVIALGPRSAKYPSGACMEGHCEQVPEAASLVAVALPHVQARRRNFHKTSTW
ncbi:MAG: hypothetical protein ACXV2F_07105 [Halobacteriota archaeon]